MSTTGFFGLQKLGASDPLSTNDYAFTNRNMDVIDRMLGKFDQALFSGTSPIDDPVDPPSVIVSTTGGILPAGRTIRYKFAWVDTYGNESAASPEVAITTSAPVTRPSQAGLSYSDTGGALLGGNYFYVLSAYVGINTSETNGGTSASLTIRGGTTNAVTITLPSLPAGADGFNIFRRGPGEAQFFYLDSVDMTVATPPTTYLDDNSVIVNNSRTPVATNLTYSTNSIAVTVPGATPYVPMGYTWKLYRSFNSGEWASTLLEWVVAETFSGSGVITPTAYDYGLQTTIGAPPDISHITTSVNRIDTLEAAVTTIETELGVNPQGGFGDVVTRLDNLDGYVSGLAASIIETHQVRLATSDITYTTTTFSHVLSQFLSSGSWIFEGQLFYTASASEDLKLQMYALSVAATPVTWANLKYQIDPDGMATPSTDGEVYTENSVVMLKGNSALRGASIHGVANYVTGGGYFYIDLAQRVTLATPVGSVLNKGSWIRFSKVA